jgi:hypothetical protein
MIALLVRLYEQYPHFVGSCGFLEKNSSTFSFLGFYCLSSMSYQSYDPGAAFVIEGVFCITNPFPLNWFTDSYKAKVYVVQVKWSFSLHKFELYTSSI